MEQLQLIWPFLLSSLSSADFLFSSQWHAVLSGSGQSLSFHSPQLAAVEEEDAITKLQREKEEKEKKEREEREERERAEKARQEEARAENGEAIPEDAQVRLPSPKADLHSSSPIDPDILKAQSDLKKLAAAHELEQQEQQRYIGKSTFRFGISQESANSQSIVGDVVTYEGAFVLNQLTATLSEVTKRTDKDGVEGAKAEVPGVSRHRYRHAGDDGRRKSPATLRHLSRVLSPSRRAFLCADFHSLYQRGWQKAKRQD